MTRPSISSYLREHGDGGKKKEPGPYLTISRQYGCDGYGLGLYLAEKLNERDEQRRWKVYYKEMLKQIAEDTGLTEEILERERVSKPSLFKDFLRGLKKNDLPDRLEIHNNITLMVRTIAYDGYSIIIGQGGASATADLANGLSIRIEAPKDWRIARICNRESLDRNEATAKVDQIEAERVHVRVLYEQLTQREPVFNLIFDNALFPKEMIAELILKAMEEKKMIEKKE